MSTKQYDLLVFVGRFQPFHSGHRKVIEIALEQCKQLLILVGSSYKARDIKNPFTYHEREQMILGSLDPQHIMRSTIRPLRDYLYSNNQWLSAVQNHVSALLPDPKAKIGIIGHNKDDSSWYLKAFPQWDFVQIGKNYVDKIDATTIRQMWLTGNSQNFIRGVCSEYTMDFLFKHFSSEEHARLAREYEHIRDYRKPYENLPYEVAFNTVDAVVVQSGHVLLVTRKSAPGEGLLALPGGHLNPKETIKEAVFRELDEETKIKVPPGLIRGIIDQCRWTVYDAPGRSLRGRTITHAFLIELPPGPLPKVKGRDDAKKAEWIQLSEFLKMEEQTFEDHHHIVTSKLGIS